MQNDIDIRQCLDALSADCTHDEWFDICTAFKSAGGDYDTFNNWSAKATNRYDEAACKSTWNSIEPSNNPDGAAGWLQKMASNHGGGVSYHSGAVTNNNTPVKNTLPDNEKIQEYINKCATETNATENYFCNQRGLSVSIIKHFNLGFDPAKKAAIIPYPGENYYVLRYVNIAPNEKGISKKYENPTGNKKVFNANALKQNKKPVFLLEGQIDTLSIIDCGGIACTGLNEKDTFIDLLKDADVPGYIIIADADETGRNKATKLKADIIKTGNLCEIVTMPNNAHDVNAFLLEYGRNTLSAWITQQEVNIMCAITPVSLNELQKKITDEGEKDPNELIKHRFLCRGGAGILAAESGCGKSSLIMQIALHWGAGLPCFDFEPTRPLNIILIQAENDERDLTEEINGVCRGASMYELLAQSQINAAKDAVKVITDATHSGDGFISMLDKILSRETETDLIIIDPLFAFAGCNLSDQEKVSHFLRNQINPLLQKYNVAALFVHHMAKPSRQQVPSTNFNNTYNYHGSAEIANWARFTIVLERCKDKDGNIFFELTTPKRGRRLKWEKNTKYLCWCDNYIYWQELQKAPAITENQVITPELKKQLKEEEKQRKLQQDAIKAAELFEPGQTMTATQLRDTIRGRLYITSKDKVEQIMAVCAEQKLLIKREPTKQEKTYPAIRAIYEKPAEPPQQEQLF